MQIVPVTAAAALAWARGDIFDPALEAARCEPPEALYLRDLPARCHYREWVKQMVAGHDAGAVIMIARTNTPAVIHKLTREGFILISVDNANTTTAGRGRYLMPPAAFANWVSKIKGHIGKIDQNSAADSGVTISR